jgi:hypothetical protein
VTFVVFGTNSIDNRRAIDLNGSTTALDGCWATSMCVA